MSFFPVTFIVALMALSILAYMSCPAFRNWLNTNKTFLDFLSIISIVGLIISLAISINQFNIIQAKEEAQRYAERCARLDAVQTEIDVNLEACTEVLEMVSQKKPQLSFSRFHYPILEKALTSGDLTKEELRKKVWAAYRHMAVVNKILDEGEKLTRMQDNIPSEKVLRGSKSRIPECLNRLYPEISKNSAAAKEALIIVREYLEKFKKS